MRYPVLAFRLSAGAILLLAGCSPAPPPKIASAPEKAEPPRITQFYATPPNPPKGEKTLVCYGTENATSVTLDPPDERLWPSPSRCFQITPSKPVTYKLTAERGSERVSQSLTITQGAPVPEILNVRVDALEVAHGTPMTVCFTARNAASVTVKPGEWFGEHTAEKGCVQYIMNQTTEFKVRALDASGQIVDGEDVEVKVK